MRGGTAGRADKVSEAAFLLGEGELTHGINCKSSFRTSLRSYGNSEKDINRPLKLKNSQSPFAEHRSDAHQDLQAD